MMKTAVFALLLLTLTALTACETTSDNNQYDTDTVQTETVQSGKVALYDTSELTLKIWCGNEENYIATFKSEGDTATLHFVTNGEHYELDGFYESTLKGRITIDGVNVTYRIMDDYAMLTVGDKSCAVHVCEEKDLEKYDFEYAFLTHNYSGDGMRLEHSSDSMIITLDGVEIANGVPSLSGNTLTIKDAGEIGNNVAKNKKAVSSSDETENFPAKYATDGHMSTRWSSGYFDPSTLTVDLKEEIEIGGCIVNFETAAAQDFDILVSNDNKNWETVAKVRNNYIQGDSVSAAFDSSVKARYVQFKGLKRLTEWGYSIYEFEVYDKFPNVVSINIEFDSGGITAIYKGTEYKLKAE